ncbi:hypothetical protein ES703_98575 [subsurface metagenome]
MHSFFIKTSLKMRIDNYKSALDVTTFLVEEEAAGLS